MRDRRATRWRGWRCRRAASMRACAPTGMLIDKHTDGAYAVLRCRRQLRASAAPTLAIELRAAVRRRPAAPRPAATHARTASAQRVFAPTAPRRVVGGDAGGPLAQFVAYVREGMWHIWIGFDHILFLLSLLLPAVLRTARRRAGSRGELPGGVLGRAQDRHRVHLAHSITLTLAALGVVSLPSRWSSRRSRSRSCWRR